MTFNWNPSENELLNMCNNVMNKISFVYKNDMDSPYILKILRNENIVFSNEYNYFAFMHDITDKPNIKKICRKILNILTIKKNSLYSNKKLYEKLKNILQNCKDLSSEDIRFLKYMYQEFEQNGIKYDDLEIRKQIIELKKEILLIENIYNNNLDDEPLMILTKEEVDGLDDIFLKTYKSKDKYMIKLNEHTYNYLIENLEKQHVREKLQKYYFYNYRKNDNVLMELIKKRNKLGNLLGYDTYVDLVNKYQTLNSSEKINEFISKLNNYIDFQYKEDIYEICRKLNIMKINDKYELNAWDLPYYINKYKKGKYNIGINLYEYFPINETFNNILKLFETSFNIKIVKIENTNPNNIWHPKVVNYNVIKDNNIIGEIFFDLYTRENKSSDSSTITIREPLSYDNNIQIAIVCIMTNFPVEERNNCFNFGEISILIHEMLHGLHIILGKCKYTFLCSNNIDYSFIETFPQLMELWLNDKKVIKYLSCHYQTKKQLDDNIIDVLIKSNNQFKSISIKYQILLSLLDNKIYNNKFIEMMDSNKKPLNKLYSTLFNSIFNSKHINIFIHPENNPILSFSHIAYNYSGQYYGYIWSDHIANKLFELIQNKKIEINTLVDLIVSANKYSPSVLLKKYLDISK
jgi:Zn-dependent oligopeptidase